MADVTSLLRRLTDLADSILYDLKSLKELNIIQGHNTTNEFLNSLDGFTDNVPPDSNISTTEPINHYLLQSVRYHLEGTVLTIIGVLGMFGKT